MDDSAPFPRKGTSGPRHALTIRWRGAKEWRLEAVLPENVEAVITLPRFGWGAGTMTCDGEVVWSDAGWTRFHDDRSRSPHRDTVQRVSATVTSPGRHVVTMVVQ